MATHSSILAWKIPWTDKPGGSHGATESAISEHTYTPACCNAGDAGTIPGQGPKIPYAEEQLSPQQLSPSAAVKDPT